MLTAYSWRVIRADGSLAMEGPHEAESLSAAERSLPAGAYTTLRTVGRTGLLLLGSHLARLEESAGLMGHPVRLERAELRPLLCQVLRAAPWPAGEETRLRLTLDCVERPGELWLSIEPLTVPSAEEQRAGVAVRTATMHRENPKAKDNAFIAASRAARALLGGRVNEVLMVGPDERVLEGLSSNFFGIRAEVLWTAEAGVLPGLTRTLVLDEAEAMGLPIRREAVAAWELPTLNEAFISSTSRSVLPIVEADGQRIGTGQPGPLTRQLAARVGERLQREVERVCDTVSA